MYRGRDFLTEAHSSRVARSVTRCDYLPPLYHPGGFISDTRSQHNITLSHRQQTKKKQGKNKQRKNNNTTIHTCHMDTTYIPHTYAHAYALHHHAPDISAINPGSILIDQDMHARIIAPPLSSRNKIYLVQAYSPVYSPRHICPRIYTPLIPCPKARDQR